MSHPDALPPKTKDAKNTKGHSGRPIVRPATVADVAPMADLINAAAELGQMLPKSLSFLYENIREFQVVADSPPPDSSVESTAPIPENEPIIAVGGLSIIWANLAEVVSLVVDPTHRGRGLGRLLVEKNLQEARRLGIRRIMTLTYEQAFFERLGFTVLDRKDLPLKVWQDCVRCPKNEACDEIAMVCTLEDVPEIAAPRPAAPSQYIVPVIRTAPA